MKNFYLAMVAAGFAVPTLAQNVQIYGVIDSGVQRITGVNGGNVTLMPSITSSVGSRLGFRGVEDLGNGLKANFVLETGFAPESGILNQGGRQFGRQANVGLSGNWGNATLGRQYNMTFYSLLEADVLGANAFGSASMDSYLAATRSDNTLGYRGTFNGFTVGATYSFGRDTTNCAGESGVDRSACTAWTGLVKYDGAFWGVAAAVDVLRGGPGGTGGLVRSELEDKRRNLNGYVKFGDLKLTAAYIKRNNDAAARPVTNLFWAGASYAVTPSVTVDAQLFRLDNKNSPNDARLAVLRATYALSKRTAVYAMAGRMRNEGQSALSITAGQGGVGPLPGGSQNGYSVGLRHAF